MTLTVELTTEQCTLIRRLMILYGDAVSLKQGYARISVRKNHLENANVNGILNALVLAERKEGHANSARE